MGVARRPRPEPHRRRPARAQRAAGGRCCATGRTSEAARWFDVDWDVGRRQGHPARARRAARRRRRRLAIVDGELRLGAAALAAGAGHRVVGAGRRRSSASTTGCSGGATRRATCGGSSRSTTSSPCASRTRPSPPSSTPCRGCSPTTAAFAGVRVDHVDGLADPLGYLEGLRDAIGDRWLVVEKILAADETLPRRGRSTARRATSTPPCSSTPCSTATAGPRSRDGWVRDDGRRPAVPGVGAGGPAGGARRRAASRPRAGRPGGGGRGPRRRRRRRHGRTPSPSCSVHLERYRTYLPDEEGVPALDAALPRRSGRRPDLASPSLQTGGRALDDAGRVADPLAAADRSGDGQGRRGPGVLALRCRWRRSARSAARRSPTPASTRSPRCTATTPRRPPGGRRRCSPARPTTSSAVEDVRAVGLALAARAGAVGRRSSTRGPPGPGRGDRRRPGDALVALQTVLTTPGIDVDRLPRSSSRRRARPSMHTSWTEPDEAYEAAPRAARRGAARVVAGRSTWRPRSTARRGDLAGDARGAADRARRRRPVPGHRGVPLRARRPRQPGRARPRRARRARRAGGDARRPGGVGRGRRAGGAGGRRSRRLLAARRRSTSPATSRSTPASDLVAFARTDAAGDPVLVTVVPRGRRPPAGSAVELPPGRWRHVLLDDEPEAEGRSPSTPRSPPSRPSSCVQTSDAAALEPVSDDGRGAGDGEGAVVEDGVLPSPPHSAAVESKTTVEAGGVERSAVGPAPKPSTSSERSPSRRRSTTTVSPWSVDGLLGVAAQHADRAAAARAARCRRRARCGAARSAAERRVEHGGGERRRVARVGDLLRPLVAELPPAALPGRRQQLRVAVVDEERERRRLGVLLAHEQHRRERRQQHGRRGDEALATGRTAGGRRRACCRRGRGCS